MIAPIEINRVTVKGGAGMPTSEYAQLVYKGEEIGFINEQGIFLKMWHPELKAGVFQNINTFNDKSFTQKCKLVEKNWDAIYDRYTTIIRGKMNSLCCVSYFDLLFDDREERSRKLRSSC